MSAAAGGVGAVVSAMPVHDKVSWRQQWRVGTGGEGHAASGDAATAVGARRAECHRVGWVERRTPFRSATVTATANPTVPAPARLLTGVGVDMHVVGVFASDVV